MINFKEYFQVLMSSIKSPYKTYKKLESKLIKNNLGIMISIFITCLFILCNVIISLLNSILVRRPNMNNYKMETVFDFSKLSKINYLEFIYEKSLYIVFIILLFAIAYYITARILKKNLSCIKLITSSAISFVPFFVASIIIFPLIFKLNVNISILLLLIGMIYSLISYFVIVNDMMDLKDNNTKVYFNTMGLSFVTVVIYFYLLESFMSILKYIQ